MSFFGFHPLIERWFKQKFAAPTEPQVQGWPSIAEGRHTLIAAPTGSGKTLTAFLAVIDRLLKESIKGDLTDGARVVYVSPLRALSNDMHRNLSEPLAELNELAATEFPDVPIAFLRAGLRTGDSTPAERQALVRRPPHVIVTTPESLFMLLTTERGRAALKTVETVIVDEIHALVRDKRGSHLALTLERLEALCERRVQRIGLSATQKPIERVAEFLVGLRGAASAAANGTAETNGANEIGAVRSTEQLPIGPISPLRPIRPIADLDNDSCCIINVGHSRELDLAIEVPPSELSAVCSNEQWAEVNARIVELINSHRSTLIFVNTRRMAERVTHQLTELLGEDHVGSHHGSLSSELRLQTERRLKSGELKAVVATASLELGLDVGYIDLVIQIGSPRSIATFLQRIGRSGHSLGKTPKGRLLALTRDELIECMALVLAIREGRLDSFPIPEAPLDVLLQQIVGEVAGREWNTDELYALFKRAWPYRDLTRATFDEALKIVSEGLTDKTDRQLVYVHHDRVGKRVRARPNARIAATTNAGAIPEVAQFRVVAQPEGTVVGTLDEDFATESHAGQIFLLGNTSWRIEGLRGTDMHVTDAGGAPPTIPFWRGEAPGRTLELSEEVSALRQEIEDRVRAAEVVENRTDKTHTTDRTHRTEVSTTEGLEPIGPISPLRPIGPIRPMATVAEWLTETTLCTDFAAQQTVTYVASEMAAVGLVPTQKRVIFERFFDETGGMQMVVHAPFGARITHAWGLAMRKRFCVSFDFELQATADDDGFILSLGPQHSFPLESMFPMLTPQNLRELLEIAILRIPMFQIRWRWNVNRALLVLRRDKGKKVPPALQRFRSDDLLTACFPMLTGCQENVTAEDLVLPDHPLVQQTMHDCLHEALDFDGLSEVLRQIQTGEIELIARDTREPSPFSYELLNSNPYAFLDGGEVAERRARMVSTRRSLTIESMSDLSRLDPLAIEQVIREATPLIRNADELHDVLMSRVIVLEEELHEHAALFDALVSQKRATRFVLADSADSIGRIGLRGPIGRIGPAEVAPDGDSSLRPNAVRPELPVAEIVRFRGRSDCVRSLTTSATKMPELENSNAIWCCAERLPAVRAMFPDAAFDPPIDVPDGVRTDWTDIDARIAVVRGLMEVAGPLTAEEVAARTSISVNHASVTLEALEGEGAVMRGRFRSAATRRWDEAPGAIQKANGAAATNRTNEADSTNGISPIGPQSSATEWCHRRLLARIHRLTMDGLRREIEPVSVDVYLKFLAQLHGLSANSKRAGANGLFEVISMLQGVDLPAVAWERDILPGRLSSYQSEWLDELCLTGEVGWGRLYPPARDPERNGSPANLTRVAPVSLFLREDLHWLTAFNAGSTDDAISLPAHRVRTLLAERGAMFGADLRTQLEISGAELDEVLGELISRGLLTADGFAGLRQFLESRDASMSQRLPARIGVARQRMATARTGRWSLWRQNDCRLSLRESASSENAATDIQAENQKRLEEQTAFRGAKGDTEAVEQWAWQLLRRWGVVFKDVLQRELGAPRWWQLLQVYRKLEARGEIRGGRFIAGVAGEQFALPDSVQKLRQLREQSRVDVEQKSALAKSDDQSADPQVPSDEASRSRLRRQQARPTKALRASFLSDSMTSADSAPSTAEAQPAPSVLPLKSAVAARRSEQDVVVISAVDPLNLVGILTSDERVPALASNRIALVDGVPAAALVNQQLVTLNACEPGQLDELARHLQ